MKKILLTLVLLAGGLFLTVIAKLWNDRDNLRWNIWYDEHTKGKR